MNDVRNRCAVPVALLLFLATGCRTYEPAPLDLEAYQESWFTRALDGEGIREYADRLNAAQGDGASTPAGFDPSDGLTLAEAEAVALFFNPELRVLRAEAGVPLAGSRYAGLWDDPELGFGGLHILENIDNPWVFDVGIGFTIPLSGRLGVEEDLAWAEYGSAWREAALAEWETLSKLREKWFAWTLKERQLELLRSYLVRLTEILESAQQLATRGELNPSDERLFRIELAGRRAQERSLVAEMELERLRILELLGLVPDASVGLVSTLIEPGDLVNLETSDGDLVRHPRMQVAIAAYEVAEQSLRREITKQFPDLTIGPAYEWDEGQSKIGLGGGIPVPLINRNQRGIAEAEAERNIARSRAELTYESLFHSVARARIQLETATRVREELEHELVPLVERQIEEIRKLADLGELDVLLMQDALERSFSGKVEVLDTHVAESTARSELENLLHPRWIFQPEPRDDTESSDD